jgi:polar amino acid transport system substrate-binding protein
MKPLHLVFIVLLSAVVSTAAALFMSDYPAATNSAALPIKETRLEHIKRTGVLRCGYQLWPPVLARDMNTGQMSGLFYDLMEEIGKQLTLKIEWTSEVIPGQMFTDLNVGRYDMACMAYFITPGRVREGSLTTPILYWPTYLFARADDQRFDNAYETANDPKITFAALDGEFSSIGAREHFPKAKIVAVPQLAASAARLNLVATRKADLVLTEPLTFLEYLKNNPGSVRKIAGKPVFVGAATMALPAKEPDLKEAMDGTLTYLHSLGFIDKLLKKYEKPGLEFLRVAPPYVLPKESTP